MMKTKKPKTNSKTRSQNKEENALFLYLKEINRVPLLKKDEEEKIARLAAEGNKAAMDKLVCSNLRFVVSIAKKYQGKGLPLEDLISEGNLGLLNAVKQFDVDKGYRFITYAVWWIRQAIVKAICEKGRMIRLPTNKLIELSRVEKTRQMLSNKASLNSDEEIHGIAMFLEMPEKKAAELINIPRDVLSMDEPFSKSGNQLAIKDFVMDNYAADPFEQAMNSLLKVELEGEIGKLEKRAADFIRYRYGLEDKDLMTLKEIGDHYDLSRERVRQIEKRALGQLKQSAQIEKLKSFIA